MRTVLAAALASAPCGDALADVADEPYGLRVFLTLDRQSNYATTLGRQASVAFLDGASINPAGAGFAAPDASTVTASYIGVPTASGRQLMAVPLTARWPVGGGSFSIAYAYTDTPQQRGDDGFDRALRSHEFTGLYARRLSADVSLGASARLVDGRIVQDQFAPQAGGLPVHAVGNFDGFDATAGIATAITPQWSAGASMFGGRVSTRNSVANLAPIVVATPIGDIVVPTGTVLDRFDDHVNTLGARGGLGYRVEPHLGVYADLSYLRASSDRLGSLSLTRGALGVEYSPSAPWSLRCGAALDDNRQSTWSVGAGYRLSPSVEADFAFQWNSAPEVNPELGRSRLIAASIAARI